MDVKDVVACENCGTVFEDYDSLRVMWSNMEPVTVCKNGCNEYSCGEDGCCGS